LCAHSKLNLEEALRKVLGKNITTVEKEFLIEMKQRGRWIRIISSSFFFWFLLSSAFVGAYFIKRAKARRLINQWEEEEAREDVQGY
jgi:nitrate reductase NapE component